MLDDCKAFYRDHLQPYFGPPAGCTLEFVQELERTLGHRLPESYRDYLAWMGADHEGALRGSDWFANDVIENTRYVPELLQHNNLDWKLPHASVCFFVHQGYMCAWFDLDDSSEDPQCWFYCEGDTPQPKLAGAFSEFLLGELAHVAELRRRSRGQPR